MMYSDGGPDHRLTYNSVKLALMSLFIKLDLDMLIAIRTAPNNSWANPVERIMSIVNIGLQGVGVMRSKIGEKFEKAIGIVILRLRFSSHISKIRKYVYFTVTRDNDGETKYILVTFI